jgi:hypothetical protein
MSSELIAQVIHDLRMGNIVVPNETGIDDADKWAMFDLVGQTSNPNTVIVDSTSVYEKYLNDGKEVAVYEDHIICPPWNNAFICYVNAFENVHGMSCLTVNVKEKGMPPHLEEWESMSGTHTIDWDRVQWLTTVTVWLGGRSKTKNIKVPTMGPLHIWTIPIYPDGSIADIKWVQVDLAPVETWENCIIVVLQTLNYMNCVNVELVAPHRSRSSARRIQRLIGDRPVHEISVLPISKSYQGGLRTRSDVPVMPVHVVRGHFARYGEEYGRKKLFGKYSGRFFIPQHVRGSEDVGSSEHEYIIEP